jgi:cytochrome c
MTGKAISSAIADIFDCLFFFREFLLLGLFMICMAAGLRHGYAMGDLVRGEKLYEDTCKACHSLDKNGIGPKHRGVFGRAAGAVRDYAYSAALQNSKISWNEEALDKWLADSQTLVPGNKMFFPVDDAQERSDLIAFLKEKAK